MQCQHKEPPTLPPAEDGKGREQEGWQGSWGGFNLAFLQTGSRVSQHPQPCPPHPRMLKKVLKIHHGHCKGIEQSRAEQRLLPVHAGTPGPQPAGTRGRCCTNPAAQRGKDQNHCPVSAGDREYFERAPKRGQHQGRCMLHPATIQHQIPPGITDQSPPTPFNRRLFKFKI